MNRAYQYQEFDIAVAVETSFSWKDASAWPASAGYVAIVTISRIGATVAIFSPLRFGESHGEPFISEIDALMGGYSAGRRVVDDLLTS
ncbi:hypothetical protein SAMN05414139_03449 [Burkholderia sp. D7]|nr:hypothetical protein SAMN05414139_03449 [Burkholderia sp. D7]